MLRPLFKYSKVPSSYGRLARKGVPYLMRGKVWQLLSGGMQLELADPDLIQRAYRGALDCSPEATYTELTRALLLTPSIKFYDFIPSLVLHLFDADGLIRLKCLLHAFELVNHNVSSSWAPLLAAVFLQWMNHREAFFSLCGLFKSPSPVVDSPRAAWVFRHTFEYMADIASQHRHPIMGRADPHPLDWAFELSYTVLTRMIVSFHPKISSC